MFFFGALVFLSWDFRITLANNAFIGLEQLITNLVTIDNTNLVFISDFSTESQVCSPRKYYQIKDQITFDYYY